MKILQKTEWDIVKNEEFRTRHTDDLENHIKECS